MRNIFLLAIEVGHFSKVEHSRKGNILKLESGIDCGDRSLTIGSGQREFERKTHAAGTIIMKLREAGHVENGIAIVSCVLKQNQMKSGTFE